MGQYEFKVFFDFPKKITFFHHLLDFCNITSVVDTSFGQRVRNFRVLNSKIFFNAMSSLT